MKKVKKEVTVSTKIDLSLHEALLAVADVEDRTPAYVVRKALEQYLVGGRS